MDMDVVLGACPLLERFHAEVKELCAFFLPGPWIPTQESAGTLQLHSLVLLMANFQQSSLCTLLSRTSHLEELILGHLARGDGKYEIEEKVTSSYDCSTLHHTCSLLRCLVCAPFISRSVTNHYPRSSLAR